MNTARAIPAFIVGAYAAMPSAPAEQAEFYGLLATQTWIDGLEIPFPGDLEARPAWLAGRLAPSWHTNTITAIPGTMERLGANPRFGLASPDPAGRAEALAFAERVRQAVRRLADDCGRSAIKFVQVHSAPTRIAEPGHLLASLSEMLEWDWAGAALVIEHCDRYIPGQPPEKGFLSLSEEIEVAQRAGIGVHINWGRCCLETRDADAAAEAIERARSRGVLKGVVFSGASPSASRYGSAWADAHLPATWDEPCSLMGARVIRDCADKALERHRRGPAAEYLGAKICVPPSTALEDRLRMMRTIFDTTRSSAAQHLEAP